MTRAIWKGEVIAESEACLIVEGIHYFPPNAVSEERLRPNDTRTICNWRGEANHYDVVVGGDVSESAARCYKRVRPAAEHIRGYVSFERNIEIVI